MFLNIILSASSSRVQDYNIRKIKSKKVYKNKIKSKEIVSIQAHYSIYILAAIIITTLCSLPF